MSANNPLRNKFSALRRSPGPGAGWQARCARDTGYSPGHISKVLRGKTISPAAAAAIAAWRKQNKVA